MWGGCSARRVAWLADLHERESLQGNHGDARANKRKPEPIETRGYGLVKRYGEMYE